MSARPRGSIIQLSYVGHSAVMVGVYAKDVPMQVRNARSGALHRPALNT
jgi:hypothetical protein